MTTSRRKSQRPDLLETEDSQEQIEDTVLDSAEAVPEILEEFIHEQELQPPQPEAKRDTEEEEINEDEHVIYLGEEDKRLIKRMNRHIMNILGLKANRSFRV